jgi:hypothetical protein
MTVKQVARLMRFNELTLGRSGAGDLRHHAVSSLLLQALSAYQTSTGASFSSDLVSRFMPLVADDEMLWAEEQRSLVPPRQSSKVSATHPLVFPARKQILHGPSHPHALLFLVRSFTVLYGRDDRDERELSPLSLTAGAISLS